MVRVVDKLDTTSVTGKVIERREFLRKCGKFAIVVPPTMTFLLSKTDDAQAFHTGGGGGGGGGFFTSGSCFSFDFSFGTGTSDSSSSCSSSGSGSGSGGGGGGGTG